MSRVTKLQKMYRVRREAKQRRRAESLARFHKHKHVWRIGQRNRFTADFKRLVKRWRFGLKYITPAREMFGKSPFVGMDLASGPDQTVFTIHMHGCCGGYLVPPHLAERMMQHTREGTVVVCAEPVVISGEKLRKMIDPPGYGESPLMRAFKATELARLEERVLAHAFAEGADARELPDGTLVTCELCAKPHPKGDDGRACSYPKVAKEES